MREEGVPNVDVVIAGVPTAAAATANLLITIKIKKSEPFSS